MSDRRYIDIDTPEGKKAWTDASPATRIEDEDGRVWIAETPEISEEEKRVALNKIEELRLRMGINADRDKQD